MKTTVKRGLVLRYLIHGVLLTGERKLPGFGPSPQNGCTVGTPRNLDTKGGNLSHGRR